MPQEEIKKQLSKGGKVLEKEIFNQCEEYINTRF